MNALLEKVLIGTATATVAVVTSTYISKRHIKKSKEETIEGLSEAIINGLKNEGLTYKPKTEVKPEVKTEEEAPKKETK